MLIEVPELVRQRALSRDAVGQRWLDSLADVVEGLGERWGLTVGHSYPGGTAGYVAAVTDSSGRERVLKVAMALDSDERHAFARSVEAHRLAAGRGCAVVVDSDLSASAMLLERLGPNLAELDFSIQRTLESIAATLTTFWQPVVRPNTLPTGRDAAQRLAHEIPHLWTELGEPCDRHVVDRARQYCARRAAAFDPATAVLVHGDAHGWNTLATEDAIFKFVDVEGFISEPAHDLGAAMREYNEPLLAGDTPRLTRERAEQLAGWCSVDVESVWEWGFIDRVSTGLANARDLGPEHGTSFLEVAARCL